MVSQGENELMTRVESDAPLGRLMRENYWIPFALSSNLVVPDGPTPVRLFGENYAAFRDDDGRIGFFDEHCPHRRASLLLARHEGDGIRCIYHGWKMEASGRVIECPNQTLRAERFAANVKVTHFPVHEDGGIAWVWLGGGETPPFPDLPFSEKYGVRTATTFSVLPCNWLQGFEGGFDSAHGPILHQSVIAEVVKRQSASRDVKGATVVQHSTPTYETEPAPYGLRAASLRDMGDGRTYVRVAHYFFPLLILVSNGFGDLVHVFAFAPVDDTHHLLFFGNYGHEPMPENDVAGLVDDSEPDPRNYAQLHGDRSNRWGQDRALMNNGHFSGFARCAIDEDAAVQVSMGPIADRTKENLATSDVAIAHARRLILDTIAAAERGALPPGSARSPQDVHIPGPFDATLEPGQSWRDAVRVS